MPGATSSVLLSRDEFRTQVLARSKGACVLCHAPAVDAHHILDRKLYPDGDYYLSNGAAVCAQCHFLCEYTQVSVEDVRLACGIVDPVLPPGLDPGVVYDKWGNRIWPSGLRSAGPLVNDRGMRKALCRGGLMGALMMDGYWE